MKSDLIVFGEDWGSLPSSTQHLIKWLARQRKVLWVNSIGLRQPKITLNDAKRIWLKVCGFFSGDISKELIKKNAQLYNITVINTLSIPAPSSVFSRRISCFLLQLQIRPKIKALQLKNPILWASLPTACDLVGQLYDIKSVYYCGDDFNALEGVDHAVVVDHELQFIGKANLIITSSDHLKQKFNVTNTQCLSHGVDYELFSNPVSKAIDLPSNSKPTAGFYGSLSGWLDIDLLIKVIAMMPHWNFVFIGKSVINVSALENFNNVFLLGQKEHQQLPKYSQHWDVSLLPFKNNAQIKSCNPLKLTEYLATGTPIVSTYFPAIKPYTNIINVANNASSMKQAIEASVIKKNNAAFKLWSQSMVIDQSWQAKAEQVDRWLDAL